MDVNTNIRMYGLGSANDYCVIYIYTSPTWPKPQAIRMIHAAISLNKGSISFVIDKLLPDKLR